MPLQGVCMGTRASLARFMMAMWQGGIGQFLQGNKELR